MLLQPGGAAALGFVIPLTKVDVEKRLVYGRAAQEFKDNAGEMMDYSSSKPEFERWSSDIHSASGGLSKGNIREMHTKNAAGVVKDIAFNDGDKAVDICAHIVDDAAWKKVTTGCYTGLSIGGGYLKKWTDSEGNKRYTPRLAEISLVDNPCIPTCRFAELVKADGVVERLELHGVPKSFAEIWNARPRSFADLYAEDLAKRARSGT